MPVYDKPMIFYPLTTLMLSGIRDVLVISTPIDTPIFERLLGDGSDLGLSITYAVQPRPEGLPQAFIVAEDYLAGEGAALVLGDNLLVGAEMDRQLESVSGRRGGTIFAIQMQDPRSYGVVEFDEDGTATSIEEKPRQPRSRWAIPGLYYYDDRVVELARQLKPSSRGELEIVDLHKKYLETGDLAVIRLSRGFTWLDMGSVDDLAEAANYVRTIEKRQGLVIGSPEEVAWQRGWIDEATLSRRAVSLGSSPYATYVRGLAETR